MFERYGTAFAIVDSCKTQHKSKPLFKANGEVGYEHNYSILFISIVHIIVQPL